MLHAVPDYIESVVVERKNKKKGDKKCAQTFFECEFGLDKIKKKANQNERSDKKIRETVGKLIMVKSTNDKFTQKMP